MRMVKKDDNWRIVLQAECPACGAAVEALKPKKGQFRLGRKCKSCGYHIDPVYFE